MKVLSIGNSFSQDAHRYLHELSLACGNALKTVNLYIGGCSLERHYNNMVNDLAEYSYEVNGASGNRTVSLEEALTECEYDVITVQQVSGYSGRPQTYIPYLPELAAYVREKQPKAKLYFHRTWSYEWGYESQNYAAYNFDQNEMYRRIVDATAFAAKLIDVDIIPTGDAIQKLRTAIPEFDYRNGGVSLCRDGFHLSLDYGRFAAAVVWYYTLTGRKPEVDSFGELDPALVRKIVDTVTEE